MFVLTLFGSTLDIVHITSVQIWKLRSSDIIKMLIFPPMHRCTNELAGEFWGYNVLYYRTIQTLVYDVGGAMQ